MNDTVGHAFLNGIEDRHVNGLLRVEQLYRHGRSQRVASQATEGETKR